jgi:hypothetical protein
MNHLTEVAPTPPGIPPPKPIHQRAKKQAIADSLVPGLISAMVVFKNDWDVADRAIDTKFDHQRTGTNEQQDEENEGERKKARAELNKANTIKILDTMTSLNTVRERLLSGVEQTPEDRKIAQIFDRVLAGDPIDWLQMQKATGYMQQLVGKSAPRPKPPS